MGNLILAAITIMALLVTIACSEEQSSPGLEPGYSLETEEYKAFMESYEDYAGEVKQDVIQEACNLFASVDYKTDIQSEELEDLLVNWPEVESFSSERYGRNNAITDARAFGFVVGGMNLDFNSEILRDYCEAGLK